MNAPVNNEQLDDVAVMRARIAALEAELAGSRRLIDKLEDIIRRLAQRHWGRSSEKHPGQGELSLFNEAELAAMGGENDPGDEADEASGDAGDGADTAAGGGDAAAGAGSAKPTKPRRRRVLPDHLERVRVLHELDEVQRLGACGQLMVVIGEEITEQLGVMPATHFVIQHVKLKYACPCKACGVRTAPMPTPPVPGSQASAALLAATMVGKLDWALPLYRQERIAKTFDVDLPRSKLARWMIAGAGHLAPLYNLMQDELVGYDIVASDDTGIQVLKEDGRDPSSKSALWIRRGGPPDKPVVLVDYRRSKGLAEARSLLDHCQGYLVCDAAPTFERAAEIHGLTLVLCNDHARRKFVEAARTGKKSPAPKGWIATKAIGFYKTLYAVEREARQRELTAAQTKELRACKAAPVWESFLGWAKRMHAEGVRDRATREALEYLIRHETGLVEYLNDGRLPISNIASEHVAKTVALARKNFLFADTPAGAEASAMIYSIIESAKANGQNVLKYLTVVLDALPGAPSVEQIEALLPWRLTAEEVAVRYAAMPWPSMARPTPAASPPPPTTDVVAKPD